MQIYIEHAERYVLVLNKLHYVDIFAVIFFYFTGCAGNNVCIMLRWIVHIVCHQRVKEWKCEEKLQVTDRKFEGSWRFDLCVIILLQHMVECIVIYCSQNQSSRICRTHAIFVICVVPAYGIVDIRTINQASADIRPIRNCQSDAMLMTSH